MALAFGVFALGCGFTGLFVHPFTTTRMLVLSVGLGVISAALAMRPPPEPDSLTTHVVIALAYCGTSAAMFAFSPYGTAALPAAGFIGPLVAVWLDDHRQIAAHYGAATVALLLPSLTGFANTATLVATCSLVPPTFVLGFCCLTVLRIAEAQGDQLESMAMRDPLTGLGNRRLLEEHLRLELARHRSSNRPLSVLALDLNGFKQINDALGHAAGDRLLIAVAGVIAETAGPRATVVRQGGDEFVIVAPDTDEVAAVHLKSELRDALAGTVSTGIGFATYPNDGADRRRLLELADARLIAAKEYARQRGELAELDDAADVGDAADDGGLPAGERLARIAALVDERAASAGGPLAGNVDDILVSRRELAKNRLIWRTTGGLFLFYALVGAATMIWAPNLSGPWFPMVVVCGTVIGFLILLTAPRDINSWWSRASVAATYVVPALVVIACAPSGSVSVGAALFIGPAVAVRSETRRQVVTHISVAALLFAAVAASGLIDAASILALLIQTVTMVILSVCCVVVFEAAEAQGRELELLAVLDPLTGLANRRRMSTALHEMVDGARAHGTSVAVLALDLNGFKALNDGVGHAAGDDLLVDVADQLRRVVGDTGLVARPGGDEFTVLIDHARHEEIDALAIDIREHVGHIWRHGHRISTGVGVARFPEDADTVDDLLDLADMRLLGDKYGAFTDAEELQLPPEALAPAKPSGRHPGDDPNLRVAA